jgi:hypothetical protein
MARPRTDRTDPAPENATPIRAPGDSGDTPGHDTEAGNGAAITASDFAAPDDAGEAVSDDFDNLESFALPQDFNPGVLEEDPPVMVRKPSPWDFFRVHPDPAMSLLVGIVEIADERDAPYLVVPAMYPLFGKLVSRRQLFVCKTSLMGPAAVFLWGRQTASGQPAGRWRPLQRDRAEGRRTGEVEMD